MYLYDTGEVWGCEGEKLREIQANNEDLLNKILDVMSKGSGSSPFSFEMESIQFTDMIIFTLYQG